MEGVRRDFTGRPSVDKMDTNQMVFSVKKKTDKSVGAISAAFILLGLVLMFAATNRSKKESVAALELDDPIEIETACSKTLYPETCRASLSPYLASSSNAPQAKKQLLHIAGSVAMKEADRAFVLTLRLINRTHQYRTVRIALQDCAELIDITKDQLHSSIFLLKRVKLMKARESSNVKAWLSAAMTNMETCYDGVLETSDGKSEAGLLRSVYRTKVLSSNCLAILVNSISDLGLPSEPEAEPLNAGFPSWMSAADRRLLRASADEMKADVVVAADGSGNFKTIAAAIDAAPEKSDKRYVIKVRKGTYEEYVEVGKKKMNLLLVGEGMENTIVTGSKNVIDGSTTTKSATFAAVGKGFMAQDIAFVNSAGPEKHQAVALRVGSDQSVLYRCKIVGYQDTLYAHSLRQFYSECLILGTVDFIFGNAAVVFQSCTLLPRKPGPNQKNAITAQGRTDPFQNTGISIHSCNVSAASDLKSSVSTYLGRPWKEYSRTVYMQSYMDDAIHPAGWLEWSGDFALSTLYYGEYKNSGPGAVTQNRVKWGGYRVINSSEEATKFTVDEFIQGSEWLDSTGVEYIDGLIE